jgi:hypothetical protein
MTAARRLEADTREELIPGATSRSIARAVVIKDEELFLVTEMDGSVPFDGGHGFGLYYHDCRFLDGYELRLSGRRPESLVHTAEEGDVA